MILKWLLLIAVIYLTYRLFTGPGLIGGRRKKQIPDQEPDEDGYVDFEEID
jgi:hypothetical protein